MHTYYDKTLLQSKVTVQMLVDK